MLDGLAAQLAAPALDAPAQAAHIANAAARPAAKLAGPIAFGVVSVAVVVGIALWMRGPAPAAPAALAPANAPAVALPSPAPRSAAATGPTPVPAAEPQTAVPPVATPATRRARRTNADQPVHAPTVAAAEDPVAELALLERAQRVLRSDPAAALALAETHRTRMPQGTLAQEREMLAIEALFRLDRDAQAQRRARAFEQRYPHSSHRPRLRDLLTSPP